MGIASATSLAGNQLTPGDAGVGGRGSIEQRGFDLTLTLIARLEAVTLSLIEPIQIHSRVHEWETDTLRSPFINANPGFAVADYSANGPTSFSPTSRTILQNYSQVFLRQIVTEGTLRREETNTGDEHEYQVEEKEAIALGRDINSSLLWSAGVPAIAGTSSTRIAGGLAAFAGNVWLGNGAPGTGGTASVWNWQTVAYTQAAGGGAVTAVGTTTGGAITADTVVNRLPPNIASGSPGFVGSSVPVMTTAAVAGTGGYVTDAFSRKLLSAALSPVYTNGGFVTNIVQSPGLRAVFTEVIGRGGSNDLYRVNLENNEEIRNTTSIFISDFGYHLRVDTEQQLQNYSVASGGSPGGVPALGFAPDNTRMIAFNPKNVKFGVITPVTRNDDIPQPIYGASSGLVCEGTFVVYNPNDILSMYNINPDISSPQYT